MGEPLDKAIEEARSALDFLELVTGVAIPKTLDDALKQDWATVAQDTGDAYFSRMPKEELKKWKTRVMKLEDAYDIVADYEDALVKHYTSSKDEILLKEIGFIGYKLEFVSAHAGELAIVAKSLLTEIVPSIIGNAASTVKNFFVLWFEGKVFGEDEDNEVDTEIRRGVDNIIGDVAAPVWDAVEAVLTATIIELIQNVGTLTALATLLKPVLTEYEKATKAAQGKALKQGPRGGHRRRKRSRKRKGGSG